jgi:hypothetical protein
MDEKLFPETENAQQIDLATENMELSKEINLLKRQVQQQEDGQLIAEFLNGVIETQIQLLKTIRIIIPKGGKQE